MVMFLTKEQYLVEHEDVNYFCREKGKNREKFMYEFFHSLQENRAEL